MPTADRPRGVTRKPRLTCPRLSVSSVLLRAAIALEDPAILARAGPLQPSRHRGRVLVPRVTHLWARSLGSPATHQHGLNQSVQHPFSILVSRLRLVGRPRRLIEFLETDVQSAEESRDIRVIPYRHGKNGLPQRRRALVSGMRVCVAVVVPIASPQACPREAR